jgi:hypothetical protein
VRDAYPALRAKFKKKRIDLRLISAATREGVEELCYELYRTLREGRGAD